jgi:hypothetical protein
MALTINIRADATQFRRTIAGVEVQASGLAGVIGKLGSAVGSVGLGAALTAAAAGAVALGAGLAFIKDASGKAAGIESLTMQFETLLGSAAKAKDRMEEIKRFAASTPFEVANLSETSKLLQTLGGDMLATGAGLRMVGDAAAIAGQPIQEVGLHFGRLFNAITSGTSAGESIGRLQELGLMTGKVKIQFEALAAAQKKGEKPILTQTQAMTLLQGVFSKTAGAMERLSTTTKGKVSNMKDAVDNLKVAFGTGFNDGLKSALDATNNFLPTLEEKFANLGSFIGVALKQAVEGDPSLFIETGLFIGDAIMRGIKDTLGNAIVDGVFRPVLENLATGARDTSPESKARSKDMINSVLGPSIRFKERARDIADEMASNSEDLLTKGGIGNNEELVELKKGRTAQETLVMLYRNAEARRERGRMFSR